jgi:organic hydroperoxide reductase OsmC/OhrA
MPTLRSNDAHEYRALLTWTGNTGSGTATYDGYGRSYRIAITGKPSSDVTDAAFRSDTSLQPQDLRRSGVHMLSYLALCARRGVSVVAYEDHSSGVLRLKGGGGAFEQVTIAPVVTIADGRHASLAAELHDRAAECCFIANSCRVPIHHRPTIRVQEALHV